MSAPRALFLLTLVLSWRGFRRVRALTLFTGLATRRSSIVTADSVDITVDWPPSHPDFFAEQLALCRRLIEEDDGYRPAVSPSVQPERRTKFVEHPRCTARFGEVLIHVRNEATAEDYHRALHNARAVVQYVDTATEQQNGRWEMAFEGLSSTLADALSSRSLAKFRRRQLDVCAEEYLEAKRSGEDVSPEEADLKALGRLYYSAVRASEPVMRNVKLTTDHGGFTVLLALCRAASAATAQRGSYLAESGLKLDAALSAHFNGIQVPGRRFLFSPRHGLDHKPRKRASRLVVAFSSLGNGLVRHEFGATLANINSVRAHDGEEEDVFDVLFVADPAQSWYQKDSFGGFGGFAEYSKRIRAASRPYSRVSFLGDSMGASAALIFSNLATDAVVGFSPQVDLCHDDHVGRDDLTLLIRQRFLDRLMESVEEATARGVEVTIHRGVEKYDVWHTEELVEGMQRKGFDSRTVGPKIVEHEDCSHHQTVVHLKQQGTLSEYVSLGLLDDSMRKNV